MKKRLLTNSLGTLALSVFGLTASLLSPNTANAQCAFNDIQYPGDEIEAPETVGEVVEIATCSYAGEHAYVEDLIANNLYTIDFTDGTPGYITVFDVSNNVVGFGVAPYGFIPPVSGDYKTQWTLDGPSSCGTDSDCHITSIEFTAEPPAAPPVPVQAAGTPVCSAGADLTVTGSPAAGLEWYWQVTANGTSTATPYAGTYNVPNNNTYYLRTYDPSTGLWSTASSVVVSNFPTITAPPAPTADANPSCAPAGSVLSVVAAPAGFEYYWQTSVNGASTANNATTPLNAPSTGTYYVAAYETATECWSPTVSINITVNTYIPPAPVPTEDPVNVCVNASSAMLEAAPAPSSGTTVLTLASNVSIDAGDSENFSENLVLPAGATVTSSTLTFDGVTTGLNMWLTDFQFDLNGAANTPTNNLPCCGGATDGGPYDFTPSIDPAGGAVDLEINNWHWMSSGSIETITLTVNWTIPAATIAWYDAGTAGTMLGAGPTLEGVGTTVMPNTSSVGTHTFYAASVVGGCQSVRTSVDVNITPVLAELIPSNVTCNGLTDGTFDLGTVSCGTGPFTYSIDGGAFGAIPTDLDAGTYIVTMKDATAMISAPITVVITAPSAPQDLVAVDVNYYSAELGWTAQGNETTWTLEYGPAGFTPGDGSSTTVTATSNPFMITGLDADTDYEFYVAAACSPLSEVAGPAAFSTNPGFFTSDNACGPGFIDISTTGTALNLGDDDQVTVTASQPINFQGISTDQVQINNNGRMYIGSATFNVWSQDLDSEEGNVYYQTVNVGGTDYFVVEWFHRPDYPYAGSDGQSVTFEAVFDLSSGDVYYIYDDKVFGGTQSSSDYGSDAYISCSGPLGTVETSDYSTTYLTNNSCAHYYNALCPNITSVSIQPFADEAFLNLVAGLYGETDWTIIYGEAGFDPATEGTTITTSSTGEILGNLTQLTEYDVYIYSECQADGLTSGGYFTSFTTLPYCSIPSNLGGNTLEDQLNVSWNWNSSDPGTYVIDHFNLQYGNQGFDLYAGTDYTGTATNFADTIVNTAFLAGALYDVYVQAVCETGDTSTFAGPFTLTMPLTNDAACGVEMIGTDGTVYTFNNDGATTETDESTIAPPADGAQTTTGWNNTSVDNTTWFSFIAPASGSVRINNTAINYNGQVAVYEAADCGDFSTFVLVAANDNEIGGTSLAPNFTICGLTPGNMYYLMHDSYNGSTGNYSLSVNAINLNAGTANPTTNVCAGDNVDLFSTISGEGANGVWSSDIPVVDFSIDGSDFETQGLAFQVYDIQYRITDGCAYDSIVAHVEIFGPSNAGQDGTITACRNEPINLYAGLIGTVDHGGDWYNPLNQLMPGADITTSNVPGDFNFDYIANNGACPNDTANVTVTVLANCNWIGLEEELFSGVSLYPNPSEGIVFITSDVAEAFDYTITDAKGSVVATAKGAIKNATSNQIDLSNAETGVYFISLSNSQAQKVFRVVIQ